jgi:hypothetical protein
MRFSAKKIFLIGFVLLLLVGIPVSVYLVQQQQELRTRAEKATNLSFQPESSVGSPITKSIGQTIPLDIMVDPGTNLVSFVKLEIQYDPDKLATAPGAFQVNSAIFPTILGGPVYSPGKILVSMSVGTDPTKAIQTKVRAATLNLKAVNNTVADTPTLVTFSVNTLVTSLGPNDQASENVLAGTTPATIVVSSGVGPSPTDVVPTDVVPTDVVPTTVVPTTVVPTTVVPTEPVPTEPVPTVEGNIAPVCTALTADTTSGTAPLSVNFTANGTDADDSIAKATFNFGDGQVSDVTSGGSLGTNSVNVQLAHTYSTAGTFQATAILTDSNNGVSETTNCSQTITVSGAGAANTATPTIAAAGSAEVLMGFGAVAAFLMVAGAFIFFML